MSTFGAGSSRSWTQLPSPPERRQLLGLGFGGALLLGVALVSASAYAQGTQSVDLATVAQAWTMDYDVRGTKTEPTFVEHVEYARQGDRFTLRGDFFGEELGVLALDLGPDGAISVAACPQGTVCTEAPPNGFLSTVAVLAALRAGRLTGSGDVVSYAGRLGVCVPLEAIQSRLDAPVVLDPCVDLQTGALLAERRRFDNQFGGAMLDEASFQLVTPPSTAP
jgi:hypothetical protein